MRTAYALLGHAITWALERIVGRGPMHVANATHEPLGDEDT